MGTPLRQLSDDAIHALAVVLSLSPDRLEHTGKHHRAKPAASWLSEQEARITGLPNCLQIPSIPHMSVKVAQVAKRVIIAASGGADTLAAKAAIKGISVDAILHPCATPTVLCPAHRGLHPTVVREIFYYLSREVADHADLVRRHPHGEGTSHTDDCSRQSRDAHDWGLRMIGISALWCTPHTFRALEKGRQASVPGYRLPRAHKHSNDIGSCSSSIGSVIGSISSSRPTTSSSATSPSSATTATTTTTTTTTTVPAPHIRAHMRLPHLEFPCEACVLAAVGARSQNLIDLRASMLSRMALEKQEAMRRAKNKGKPVPSTEHPERYPNLWALVDAYINVLGMEYGEEIAHEIRLRSVTLGQTLFRARLCENRRQRRHAREIRRRRSAGKSTRKIAEKRPPRMVTNRGHRLPLPLVPLDYDLWAYYNESVVGENQQPVNSEVPNGSSDNNNDNDNDNDNDNGNKNGYSFEDAERLYFVVQDSQDDISQEEEGEGELEDGLDYDAYTGKIQDAASGAKSAPIPDWEEDYIRNIFESQTVFSDVYDRPPARCENHDEDDASSYVTISVHTEMPLSQASANSQPGTRSGPSKMQRALSTVPGTPITPGAPRSTTGSDTQRSSASSIYSSRSGQTPRPISAAPAAATASDASAARSHAPFPVPSEVYPPAPSSSVYSQPVAANQSRPRVSRATQATCRANVSSTSSRYRASSTVSTSTTRPSTTSTASSRPPMARPTASSFSRSVASRSAASAASTTPSKAPSTAFVPPSTSRIPASAKSYVALQAELEASFSAESSSSSNGSRTNGSATLSRESRSTTNTSATSRSSPSRASSQASQASRMTRATATKSTRPLAATATTMHGLGRNLAMPKTTPYKAPSMAYSVSLAQHSAVPTPLAPNMGQRSSTKAGASGPVPPSGSPSGSTPRSASATPPRSLPPVQPSTAPSTSSSQKSKWPARPPAPAPAPRPSARTAYTAHTAPTAPATPPPKALLPPPPPRIVKSNRRAAAWAASAPSTFSWCEPSPSVAPSLAGLVEAQGPNDTDCLVLPEDSISVVATQRFMAEVDEDARREMEIREMKEMKERVAREKKETKEKKVENKEVPIRNLNHYQPSTSRQPVPPEARNSQSSQLTQWPTYPLMI
ncbi:hypothetical protein SCUCBS95973_003281 [Sporothrix curviconia]|uniref:Uncharacterized protein n=1 Tax=Sporothrix curviconia TaxID=1260050 RepID=A0ABP0BFB9_9PEZI